MRGMGRHWSIHGLPIQPCHGTVETPHGVDFSNSVVQAPFGTSKMLEEAAQWAKRNAKALKLARYALQTQNCQARLANSNLPGASCIHE